MKINLKFISVLVALALTPCFTANAQRPSTIVLNNGSSIEGHIVFQRPGTDIMVKTENAQFVVEENNSTSINSKKVKYENLSREWKRWAIMNNALQGDANGRYLEMYDIKTNGYTYTNVVRVERDKTPKVVYMQVMPENYKVKLSDVKSIERPEPTEKEKKGGVDDEVTLFGNKTYKGTIVNQIPGKSMTIATADARINVSADNVYEVRKVARLSTDKLYNQSDYRNTIVMKDGSQKEGVISVQRYGKTAKDQFMTLVTENGKNVNVKSADISEIYYNYVDKQTATYKAGGVYANEFLLRKANVKTNNGNTLYVDKKVYAYPEGVVITFKAAGDKLQDDWYLIALDNITDEGMTTQGYTAETRVSNAIKPSSKEMTGDVTSINYVYLSPGFYALVNDNNAETYVIKIRK